MLVWLDGLAKEGPPPQPAVKWVAAIPVPMTEGPNGERVLFLVRPDVRVIAIVDIRSRR